MVNAQLEGFYCCDIQGCWTADGLYFFFNSDQVSFSTPNFQNVYDVETGVPVGTMLDNGIGGCSFEPF